MRTSFRTLLLAALGGVALTAAPALADDDHGHGRGDGDRWEQHGRGRGPGWAPPPGAPPAWGHRDEGRRDDDHDGWRDGGREEWRERGEREWRDHEWREDRAWRDRRVYAPPRPYYQPQPRVERRVVYGSWFGDGYTRIVTTYYGRPCWAYSGWRGEWRRPYDIGYALPPGLAWGPPPPGLFNRLPPAPWGYSYIVVDGDLLLIDDATRLVVDAILLGGRY